MSTSVSWGSTPFQWGVYSAAGVWTDNTTSRTAVTFSADLTYAGLIFNANTHQTFQTQDADGTTKWIKIPYITAVTLTGSAGVAGTKGLKVWLIREPQPTSFSTGDGPPQRSLISLGTYTLGTGEAAIFTLTPSAAALAEIEAITQNANWQGYLALAFQRTPGSTTFNLINSAGFPLQLNTTQTAAEEPRWSGFPLDQGRSVYDMKTGLPALSDWLVEDDYKKGIWTVPAQYDPDDPRNERPTELPSTEGERGDDIPA